MTFLPSSPPAVLRQFLVRATGAFEVGEEAIAVATSSDTNGVRFISANRLVLLPICGDEEELHCACVAL